MQVVRAVTDGEQMRGGWDEKNELLRSNKISYITSDSASQSLFLIGNR